MKEKKYNEGKYENGCNSDLLTHKEYYDVGH